MSKTNPITQEALIAIVDQKFDEKLKPMCQLDTLESSVNFVSDQLDALAKKIEDV